MKTEFTHIAADTRINVKIKAQAETEINGKGPKISDDEVAAFKKQFDKLTENDVVILSGSLAPSLSKDFYFELIELISNKGADFVIDTTGESLMRTLKEHPLVVKPNHHELAEIFNAEFTSFEDMIPYGEKLLSLGAKNVLLSMGADGAALFTETGIYRAEGLKGQLKNSVGSGDSMVAGFVSQYVSNQEILECFKYGVASGSATAFSDDLATRADILNLVEKVEIKTISNK